MKCQSVFPAEGSVLFTCGLGLIVLCRVWVMVPNAVLVTRRSPNFCRWLMRRATLLRIDSVRKNLCISRALKSLTALAGNVMLYVRNGCFDRLSVVCISALLTVRR